MLQRLAMATSIFVPFILFFIAFILCRFSVLALENDRKLIVISMDGLMPAEIQPEVMPFISKVYKNDGVYCSRLQPVFPTKTFVNHFSIATGQHELVLYLAFVSIIDHFIKIFVFPQQVCMPNRMEYSTLKFTITNCINRFIIHPKCICFGRM